MFDNFFKKHVDASVLDLSRPRDLRAQDKVPLRVAPGCEVSYHADLIPRFLGHHATLRKVFAAMRAHAAAGKFADAHKSLQVFRRAITAHLLEENVKLYTYLTKCLVDDPGSREVMLDMRAEMMQIGKTVMTFVGKYSASGITAESQDAFLGELDHIGEVLVERMEREEESLYTMYMPPEAFG